MISIMTPAEPAATSPERTLRIPAIAADLLPEEIIVARRTRRHRRLALSALVVSVAVLGSWDTLVHQQTSVARTGLNPAQSDVPRLGQPPKALHGGGDSPAE